MKGFWEFMIDPNLIGSFLGAFLSGSIALLIYFLDKRDKKKQEEQDFLKIILELKDYESRIKQVDPIMTKTIEDNKDVEIKSLDEEQRESLTFALKAGMSLISSELNKIHQFLKTLNNKDIPINKKTTVLKLKNNTAELQKSLKLLYENGDSVFIILAPKEIDRFGFRKDYYEKIDSIKKLIEDLNEE